MKCNNLTNVRGALEESKSLVTDVFISAAPADADALSHISWQKGKTHSPQNNGGRLVARREKTYNQKLYNFFRVLSTLFICVRFSQGMEGSGWGVVGGAGGLI